MQLFKQFCAVFLASMFVFTGCSSTQKEPSSDVSSVPAADPKAALETIYETVTVKGLNDADDKTASEIIGLDLSQVEDYTIRYASGNFGVADVYIVKPKEGCMDDVVRKLNIRKESRIREFENYDVLNSHAISQKAVVFEQGGYAVLLMLEDNDAARKIIDQYIPHLFEQRQSK